MGDLVNLRRFRKQRARQEAAAKAEASRMRFGRSGTERRGTAAEAARRERQLDGKRLQPEAAGEGHSAEDRERRAQEKPEGGK